MRYFALSLMFASALCSAQSTPDVGSPGRKAIMDSMRSAVKKSLRGKPVIFQVDHLKIQGDWAFMKGIPRKPNGSPFDYRGTDYWGAIQDGAFDDWVCGLLKKSGKKWVVKAWALGGTDVTWFGWWDEYKAPKSIFPSVGG